MKIIRIYFMSNICMAYYILESILGFITQHIQSPMFFPEDRLILTCIQRRGSVLSKIYIIL